MAATDPCATSLLGEHEDRIDADALGRIALFSSLNDATLALLSRRLPVRVIEADEVVFHEGDVGRAMFVVLEGSVAMSKKSLDGRVTQIVTADAGDWFGEMSLLDVMARPVTARTVGATKLLSLCPTDLSAVYRSDLKMYALLVMNMARQLSRKLRGLELSLACALCGEAPFASDD